MCPLKGGIGRVIRRNQAFLNKVNMLLDILLTVLAYVLASWVRLDFLNGAEGNPAAVGGRTVLMAFIYALIQFLLLSILGFYNTTRTRRLRWKIRTIMLGVTVSILVASTLLLSM